MLSFGPYETLSRIAAGGMGEVFVARRLGTGDFEKRVALKVLLPHLAHDREFVERFFDEARLVARMNHPNVVQIFDVGETDGRPWLAMALVEAVSLARLIQELNKSDRPIPLPMARLIATGLLEGLAYAHALKGPRGEPLNVVHRDITPSNILVSREGAVLLTDFGIAKATINMHHTKPGGLRGKMAYVSPEALGAEPMDLRSDLFSAAVTLFHLLTGVSVFRKATDVETMDAVRTAVHPRASKLRPDITPGIDTALERALSRDPAERFANAREMREAFCDGPVATSPELGELVRQLCGNPLGNSSSQVTFTPPGPGTSSLPVHEPSLSDTDPSPVRRGRLLPSLAAAVIGFVLVVGVGLKLLGPAGPEPVPPPPVVAPKPEPVAVVPLPSEPARVDAPVAVPQPEPDAPRPADPARAQPPSHATRPTVRHDPRFTATHAPAADPVVVGYLTADSQPWAYVLVDGHAVDRTPISRTPVSPGSHVVVFRREDGHELKRTVQIEEGQLQIVRVDFAAP